jgi:hypothetical protein
MKKWMPLEQKAESAVVGRKIKAISKVLSSGQVRAATGRALF